MNANNPTTRAEARKEEGAGAQSTTWETEMFSHDFFKIVAIELGRGTAAAIVATIWLTVASV